MIIGIYDSQFSVTLTLGVVWMPVAAIRGGETCCNVASLKDQMGWFIKVLSLLFWLYSTNEVADCLGRSM